MPTAEETEVALGDMEGDFPDEVAVIRRRLAEVAEERPLHSWLREVVEAVHRSSTATEQMSGKLGEVVPGIGRLDGYLGDIAREEKKRTKLLTDEQAKQHELALHGADTWRSVVDGAVTMGITAVKHPAFWSAVSVLVTWLAMTYGLPLPETLP